MMNLPHLPKLGQGPRIYNFDIFSFDVTLPVCIGVLEIKWVAQNGFLEFGTVLCQYFIRSSLAYFFMDGRFFGSPERPNFGIFFCALESRFFSALWKKSEVFPDFLKGFFGRNYCSGSSSDILWPAHYALRSFLCRRFSPLSSFSRQTDNFREVRRDFDELNFTLNFTRSESGKRTCPRFQREQ